MLENPIPAWDDNRDEAFFRAIRGLFSRSFTDGASVLLASYDREPVLTMPVVPAPAHRAQTARFATVVGTSTVAPNRGQ